MEDFASELFEEMRKQFVTTLCPDRCKILDMGAHVVTYSMGEPQIGDPVFRSYNESEDIPCRVDIARAFRPAHLPAETSEVEEYSLELPFDLDIATVDIVILNDVQYHFRKLSHQGNWMVSQVGLLMRVDKINDTAHSSQN